MKIFCYADPHFCERSSIVTRYGTRYTTRLENLISSINWAEGKATELGCNSIVCLGDFFDKAQLTDQELTALNEIMWAKAEHFFLVGNHESEENDLQYSSTMALASFGHEIISTPTLLKLHDIEADSEVEFAFLPYIVESNRRPISEYFEAPTEKLRLLFSHNDILGIQLGPVVSHTGFSIEELESCCNLCVNGHLHSGTAVSHKILNLGNLTGKDFSENALTYAHRALVIDTEALQVDLIENPYAFNFYKLEITVEADLALLNNLKNNAVLSIKCVPTLVEPLRELLLNKTNIIDSRIVVVHPDIEIQSDISISDLCVDQCEKFAECCRAKLDNSALLEEELSMILQ